MTEYSNENRGALFRNDRATSDKHPTHTGKINVEGRDYYVNAWVKEGKKGKFFSLSVKPMDDQPEGHPERFQRAVDSHFGHGSTMTTRQRPNGFPERPKAGQGPMLDDDVPFAPEVR